MEKIDTIKSGVVPILIDDIDTDQIIPARFLKSTSKEGFGKNLFHDWRYHKDGSDNEEFVLNQEKWKGEILLAGNNFGCGSSREHAAWALKSYGFNAIISTYFADIFKGNALNNGILPIEVSEDFYEELLAEIELDPETQVLINLPEQTITLLISGIRERFSIGEYKKECLLKGLDDLGYLINLKSEIETFEDAKATV